MEYWDWTDVLIVMGIVASVVIGAGLALGIIWKEINKNERSRPKR